MKKISIVLPVFNGERFLKDSIDSILNQSYSLWELIIVDDFSNDKTPEIIKEYVSKDSRIIAVRNERNLNLPASLNVGFNIASGDYYTWTSDDNMYKTNAIETMVNFLNNNPQIDLVSFNEDIVNENGEFQKLLTDMHPNRNVLNLIKYDDIGACFMYRKEIAKEVGQYNEEMFCAEDYEYWCRIALKGNIAYQNENLYIYRTHPNNLSSTRVSTIGEKITEIRHTYAVAIMKKLNIKKQKQVEYLLDMYYSENQDLEWIKMAKQIGGNFFFLYKMNHLLKKYIKELFHI